MSYSWRQIVLLSLIPFMVATSCGNSNTASLKGKTVTIFGPEVDQDANSLNAAFKPFEDQTGIIIKYQGDRSFEQQIVSDVDSHSEPDIAMFPQPGNIKDFMSNLKPLSGSVESSAKANFDKGWLNLVTFNNKIYGVPVKADLKSLIWYSPKAFASAGYSVPTTFNDFLALADKMVKDGKTPFCAGISSEGSTGWPATDWIEDWVLRLKGPDFYDRWVNHQIPFNDPGVVQVAQSVVDLWSKPGYVKGGMNSMAGTPWQTSGNGVLDGSCMMYHQGNFQSSNWPSGTQLGPNGDVDAFYLPGVDKNSHVTEASGIYASAFNGRPEVVETMKYLASIEYSNDRAVYGGYLSPNKNADSSKYPTAIERDFSTILEKANPVRFDASDLMPGSVGSGTFWTAMVEITNGTMTVPAGFAEVEQSWPKE